MVKRRGETGVWWVKLVTLVALNLCGVVVAQFDNYYNWPETTPPVVKTEVHVAGKETRIRCHIKDRFRHIQNGLHLTWEYKACRSRHTSMCLEEGGWLPLCGRRISRKPCPPILALVEPQSNNSGVYRCHISLDSSLITLNIYMLEFIEKRRDPPVILDGMNTNVSVVAPLVAVLQCKVQSAVPPTVRWFRRLEPHSQTHPPTLNFIQYLNNTYQLLNCCPVAPLSQKGVYLSKLVIYSSSVYDSGFYICLAINDANYTYKEAYLNVLPLLRVSGVKAETGSFLGLFLIPAALALIPTVAWIMCLRPRKLDTLESAVPNRPKPKRLHRQTVTQPNRLHSQAAQTHKSSVQNQRLSLLSTSVNLDSSCLPVTTYTPAPN